MINKVGQIHNLPKIEGFFMKNTMNLSRVALLVSLISISSVAYSAENETVMQDFGAFVYAVERNFTDFFSQANKTSYNTFIIAIEKLFVDFKRKVETSTTRANTDALAKEINDLIDYSMHQFTVAYNIMKKYNGKPSGEAFAFGTEIKRDFNAQQTFGNIIAKLKVLKGKAVQADENCLVKKIDAIITMIEKKKKEWNSKSDGSLLTGLAHRMNCK